METQSLLQRRQLLQRAMLLAGLAVLPAELGAAVTRAGPSAALANGTRRLLAAVADAIIPRTDTPGAVDAGVPALFEEMLRGWASAGTRAKLLGALGGIDAASRVSAGKAFAALDVAKRHAVLTRVDAAGDAGLPGYSQLKDLITALYYLSEPGSTVELRYELTPGRWDPSLPVTADTRAEGGAALF
jgi:gluconate 2-dehydrogenase gamma chain